MATWTNENKETATWTEENKTVMVADWENLEKAGIINDGGWDYEEADLDYEQILDVDTGNAVFYEGLGVSTDWTNLNKTV